MLAHLSVPLALALMAFTAGGYAIATVGMKMASGGFTGAAIFVIALGLAAAAIAEVTLLRHADLALIYLGIVVVESLLVLTYACYVGGALSLSQIAGAVLVLGGFALVSTAP